MCAAGDAPRPKGIASYCSEEADDVPGAKGSNLTVKPPLQTAEHPFVAEGGPSMGFREKTQRFNDSPSR